MLFALSLLVSCACTLNRNVHRCNSLSSPLLSIPVILASISGSSFSYTQYGPGGSGLAIPSCSGSYSIAVGSSHSARKSVSSPLDSQCAAIASSSRHVPASVAISHHRTSPLHRRGTRCFAYLPFRLLAFRTEYMCSWPWLAPARLSSVAPRYVAKLSQPGV